MFFYQDGSSSQPQTHIRRDVQWTVRTQTQSSTEEGDEVGDQHGRAREDEDKDNEKPPTQIMQRNPKDA